MVLVTGVTSITEREKQERALRSSTGGTDLPPVKVLLVENLQNVPTVEAKSRFLTRNQVIVRRVVVKVTLYKGLERPNRECVGTCNSVLKTKLDLKVQKQYDVVFSPNQNLTLKQRTLKICRYSNCTVLICT